MDQVFREGKAIVCIVDGKRIPLSELASQHSMSYNALYQRLFLRNMSLHEALKRPTATPRRYTLASANHRKNCKCERCVALASRVQEIRKRGLDVVPILAPNPADDGRWFSGPHGYQVEVDGKLYTLADLAKSKGQQPSTLAARLTQLYWTLDEALAVPTIERNESLNHGTKYCYDHYKCRCQACREVNAHYSRQYYERQALKQTKR